MVNQETSLQGCCLVGNTLRQVLLPLHILLRVLQHSAAVIHTPALAVWEVALHIVEVSILLTVGAVQDTAAQDVVQGAVVGQLILGLFCKLISKLLPEEAQFVEDVSYWLWEATLQQGLDAIMGAGLFSIWVEIVFMAKGQAHGLTAASLAGPAGGVRDFHTGVVGSTGVIFTLTLLALALHTSQLVSLVTIGAVVGAHGHGTRLVRDTFMLEAIQCHTRLTFFALVRLTGIFCTMASRTTHVI